MIIKTVAFDALTLYELYDIMALRQEVFVVEQNCPYLDTDGVDLRSYHLMIRDDYGKLVAYTRLIPEGISYDNYLSIGRVVSSSSVRGQGIGRDLMSKSIEEVRRLFGDKPIKIGAQSYLHDFYTSFGFVATGEPYLEDGILHQKMIL